MRAVGPHEACTRATSNEPSATFECRVDNGAFAACSSPFKTAALTDGPHTFEVKAKDEAANTDPSGPRAEVRRIRKVGSKPGLQTRLDSAQMLIPLSVA